MTKHQITIKDLLDCKILHRGEELVFKTENGIISENGNILYNGREYTSLSNWAKEIASKNGLSKHYNGWKVVYTRGRPLEQFREQYQALLSGQPFEFPKEQPQKRRRITSEFNVRKRCNTEKSRNIKSPVKFKTKCTNQTCILCFHGPPLFLKDGTPTWSDVLQVVLFSLARNHPDRSFFTLSNDIYPFVEAHFSILECDKLKGNNWKQIIKMTLSHSRYSHLFENGYEVYLKTGYWRLKPSINPYGNFIQNKTKSVNLILHDQSNFPESTDNSFLSNKVFVESFFNTKNTGNPEMAHSILKPSPFHVTSTCSDSFLGTIINPSASIDLFIENNTNHISIPSESNTKKSQFEHFSVTENNNNVINLETLDNNKSIQRIKIGGSLNLSSLLNLDEDYPSFHSTNPESYFKDALSTSTFLNELLSENSDKNPKKDIPKDSYGSSNIIPTDDIINLKYYNSQTVQEERDNYVKLSEYLELYDKILNLKSENEQLRHRCAVLEGNIISLNYSLETQDKDKKDK